MNLLHVTSTLDPRTGGVAEAVRQFALALTRAGHRTAVATVDAPGQPFLKGLPFDVHPLGPSRGGYQYAPKLARWLYEQGAGGRWDAVLTHGMWQHHGLAVWRAFRRSRTPRYVFPHGMLDPWFKRTYPRKHLKKWLYWPWAEYRILRGARAVFFTCEEERRLARESFWLYRANERIATLGIAEPPGEGERQREVFLGTFPELRGKRLILFLGRLHEKKGCDLLVQSWLQMLTARLGPEPRRETDLHLVLAGPAEPSVAAGWQTTWDLSVHGHSPVPPGARPVAPPVFSLPGMLAGDLKWGALRAAEVFILPSHQENFGLAVVEALACGVPVLISDKVNLWREIEADGAGFVAPDTLEGTRQLLERWLALSAGERAAMGLRARACFETRFQIDRAAAALVQQMQMGSDQ